MLFGVFANDEFNCSFCSHVEWIQYRYRLVYFNGKIGDVDVQRFFRFEIVVVFV